MNKQDGKINNFWRLPTNSEIVHLEIDIDNFMKTNLPNCFNYQMGNLAENSMPEFVTKEGLAKIRSKIPKITLSDSRDVDAVQKERQRLVEFKEAFDYQTAGKIVNFLQYFKSIRNIFDLEFFNNKLASSAFTIANVEKMVLSGVPFWEDGDDALFGDSEESEEEEQKKKAP